MKVRKTLLVAAAGWAGLAAQANAQIPVPPVPLAVGAPVAPAAAPPATIWQKLGLGKDQKAACKQQLCATPLGQLLNNATMPLQALSGGLIPPCCPLTPSAADLADPGAQGAAAAIQADEAGAKARRAAVRYLGTVDCHYWPEAGDALIDSLRKDRNECVRWEAALALGRGCCCTKKTIEALCIVVACSDRDGAPKETSFRVHTAAAAALDHCLSCYANVSTAPAVEGEKPIEKPNTPSETTPPPVSPPVPEASASKPIKPGEAKPAPELNPPPIPAVAQRPVGAAYYARINKAPLIAILTEARRVAEKYHATPIVAETPFQNPTGHSIASLMSYATGPDTQTVIPAGVSVPANEVRAEVVSARPANLWDIMAKSADEGHVVNGQPQTVIVQQPTPKPVVVKKETVVAKPEVVVKKETAVTPSEPVFKKPSLTLAPAPTPTPMPAPMPKGEPLTLDFPPPTPMPTQMSAPATGPSPYFATTATPTPTPTPKNAPVSGPSPYFATASTPTPTPMPMNAPAAGPSPYFATAATPTATPMPMNAPTAGPSPSFATAATPTIVNRSADATASAVSSYHPTAATPVNAATVVKVNSGQSPYNGSVAAQSKPTPAPVAKIAPANLPAPVVMPATPMSTKPMPAPAAPVVPAATVPMPAPIASVPAVVPAMPANGEMIEHLLTTAKGNGPVEVRKTSIQELAKMKANTPEVMMALDGLSDDPAPAVRAEAIIAAARLRMGR